MAAFSKTGTGSTTDFARLVTSADVFQQDHEENLPAETGSKVIEQRGDEEPTDRAELNGDWSNHFEADVAKARQAAARHLCDQVDRLKRLRTKSQVAAELQLFKRDLAQCYSSFGDARSESNFLSIVGIIEAAFLGQNWKTLSTDFLGQVRKALELGTQSSVSFDDFNRTRQFFTANRLIAKDGALLGGEVEDFEDDKAYDG